MTTTAVDELVEKVRRGTEPVTDAELGAMSTADVANAMNRIRDEWREDQDAIARVVQVAGEQKAIEQALTDTPHAMGVSPEASAAIADLCNGGEG